MSFASQSSKTIRVMIVDDSAMTRMLISDSLSACPGIEVVGQARSGDEALRIIERVNPDLVTLDIQMPGMDGLETLEKILVIMKIPVIMVSALTQLGANISLEALDRGAMEFVAKPENVTAAELIFKDELPKKIRAVAGLDVNRMIQIRRQRAERIKAHVEQRKNAQPIKKAEDLSATFSSKFADKLITIGISTGGPPALSALFEALQPQLPPIVVVQHMPAAFTKPFAQRINTISQLEIKEAETGDVLRPNNVYVAPGGKQLHLEKRGSSTIIAIRDEEPVSGHKPSADVAMIDSAKIYGSRCLGIIMTGMGRDGSDGCGAIRKNGGYVLGQDENSSDVYGMNKAAFVEGNVDQQFSLEDAASVITKQVAKLWGAAPVSA